MNDYYDNERGWKNYDWLEQQTERTLTSVVWAIALIGALALVVASIVGFQETVISTVVQALK